MRVLGSAGHDHLPSPVGFDGSDDGCDLVVGRLGAHREAQPVHTRTTTLETTLSCHVCFWESHSIQR
jgi:hypothetical protein